MITRLRMTRKRFAVARRRTARAARSKRGAAFRFTLSEAARTRVAISRCKRARCRRTVTLTRARTHAGANRVAFTGKVGKRALRPGTYRAKLTATDPAGNASRPRTVTFRVVKR